VSPAIPRARELWFEYHWKVHLHFHRIVKYFQVLLGLRFRGFLVRRQRSVDIHCLTVSLQADFMIVTRGAEKARRLISPIVKRVQCVCRSNYGLPWPAAYPLLLTLLIDPKKVSISGDYIKNLRIGMTMGGNALTGGSSIS
jgi:hypothetical protein